VSAARIIRGRGLVGGTARGPALIAREPVSFLGDVDIRSGEIVGELPSAKGRRMGGCVLVFPGSMGSAGAWRFLYQQFVHRTHPVALVTVQLPDPSVVQGAIMAGIPVVCEPDEDVIDRIDDGEPLTVDGTAGTIAVGSD
jgi:predicted aconitase with swiveling domain